MSEPAGAADRVVACVAGYKGSIFLADMMSRGVRIERVCTYEQKGDRSHAFDAIRACAAERGIALDASARPSFRPGELVFLVGWQFLLPPAPGSTTIVFHDSLLPKFRGFAPTVTALIKGEPKIGVTALLPVDEVDAGPIVAQAEIDVVYPLKIGAALERQARLMAELAERLAATFKDRGTLRARAQDPAQATYSLWRDEMDYAIDWSADAREISRMVDATGFPYANARTTIGEDVISVEDATALPDLPFENRTAGKIWRLDRGRPIVVCGSGLLRLDLCRNSADGSVFEFTRLRARLGDAGVRSSRGTA